ncbi:Response regulator receiver domain-containing protein [Flavobacterium glycines]|uniref:Response regulator n=1 Tax=Flavobacterium glycines TaxID=551990 RepID=A0A1B9DTL8_9FLAO|nr:response regulator [Flavobacterium glycines]OCB73024.1 two-component system response regulator [Flavobacterium glycines]GEL10167.1 response regulator [Flavobacterium glycines]SDI78660.1 Response regulator receiver domain-containing protein [Flavobacterium glycines]
MELEVNNVEILLVEDNPDDAGLVIRALKKHNLANHLVHLSDGAQALDFIFCKGEYGKRQIDDRPKVILLDLKMPKVDGLQVLKAIREDERTESIPVVIMTSSNEERDIVEGYRLGVNSYIVKPVDFDNFSKAVAELGFYWLLLNKVPN